MRLSFDIAHARTLRIAKVLRSKVADCHGEIRHNTVLLRQVNRCLGPISEFRGTDDLRDFMRDVLGLTLSAYGRSVWLMDDALLDLLVRAERISTEE